MSGQVRLGAITVGQTGPGPAEKMELLSAYSYQHITPPPASSPQSKEDSPMNLCVSPAPSSYIINGHFSVCISAVLLDARR